MPKLIGNNGRLAYGNDVIQELLASNMLSCLPNVTSLSSYVVHAHLKRKVIAENSLIKRRMS